jgi:hypothetical protein
VLQREKDVVISRGRSPGVFHFTYACAGCAKTDIMEEGVSRAMVVISLANCVVCTESHVTNLCWLLRNAYGSEKMVLPSGVVCVVLRS